MMRYLPHALGVVGAANLVICLSMPWTWQGAIHGVLAIINLEASHRRFSEARRG